MRPLPALLPLLLLSACAGYAADYWKPKGNLLAPQLPRYGLTGDQGRCVGERLTKELSVWQLRQLADLASRLAAGRTMGVRDFSYVAGLVKDPAVAPVVAQTLSACGASAPAPSAAAAAPGDALKPLAPELLERRAPQPLRWVDLGKADTGQGISIDITSVVTTGDRREAWFRMVAPGGTAPDPVAYRLRVDCKARSITPTGARKYAEDGRLAHQENYTGEWQTPLPIEAGTVMEIAYNRVCA